MRARLHAVTIGANDPLVAKVAFEKYFKSLQALQAATGTLSGDLQASCKAQLSAVESRGAQAYTLATSGKNAEAAALYKELVVTADGYTAQVKAIKADIARYEEAKGRILKLHAALGTAVKRVEQAGKYLELARGAGYNASTVSGELTATFSNLNVATKELEAALK